MNTSLCPLSPVPPHRGVPSIHVPNAPLSLSPLPSPRGSPALTPCPAVPLSPDCLPTCPIPCPCPSLTICPSTLSAFPGLPVHPSPSPWPYLAICLSLPCLSLSLLLYLSTHLLPVPPHPSVPLSPLLTCPSIPIFPPPLSLHPSLVPPCPHLSTCPSVSFSLSIHPFIPPRPLAPCPSVRLSLSLCPGLSFTPRFYRCGSRDPAPGHQPAEGPSPAAGQGPPAAAVALPPARQRQLHRGGRGARGCGEPGGA